MSQPTSRYIYSSNSNIEQSLVKMKHNTKIGAIAFMRII
jgi:hypothetical protein